MKHHTSHIHIDESALQYNLRRVKQFAPHSKVLAMVKANAYGHGIVRVARALTDADAFGVACFAEALKLREAGITQRIILMRGAFNNEELALAQQQAIDLVIHQHEQISLLEQQSLAMPVVVWIKINTGMNRLGFFPDEVSDIQIRLAKIKAIQRPLFYLTHFSSADVLLSSSFTTQQILTFNEITQHLEGEKSLANSAGIMAWPQSHADWVRPGIMLYGVSPFADKTGADFDLQPVMTWHSELIAVRQQRAGDTVGYCRTWTCPVDMKIGIVGVGYADGFPRHASNGTPVLVNGQRVPVIGRVSMDMLAVDLSTQPQAKSGDMVTLWGHELPVEEVARHTATSAYELLCHARLRSK